MPLVTDIKPQVKNQEKVSVFLDSKYTFSLTIAQLAENKDIRINSDISEDRAKKLKKLSSLTNQYLRLLGLVYIRPRSTKEIKDKLRLKKLEPEEVQELINRLTDEGHLNDARFANWWVQSRKESKPISSLKLRSELAQKGISQDNILNSLAENFSAEDEVASLQRLIEKKRSRYDTPQKLMSFLAGRGFSYDLIKQALKEDNDDF